MPAALPSYRSIIISAMRKLAIMGTGQTDPYGEDLEFAVNELNELVGQWNTRRRFAWYMRTQEFEFSTAQQSYTIGAADNSPVPDFVVDEGNRPQRIESAQLVLTGTDPDTLIPLAVWTWQQYSNISSPALASTQPMGIYYEPALPNGVIYPYPAFPTETTNKLKLWWWNQLLTMALTEITTELYLPPGYERALALSLAVSMYPAFPKKSDLQELQRQMRVAVSDIQSVNVIPPYVDTSAGVNRYGDGGNFLYTSRTWL